MTVGVNSTGQPDPNGEETPWPKPKVIAVAVQKIIWKSGDAVVDLRETGIAVLYRQDKSRLDLHSDGHWVQIPADEVIKVARDMQSKQRQEPADTDDIDHGKLLKAIVKHADDNDGTVQVLEGSVDDVKLEHFSGNTPESIHELIHFIKVNNLQETKPWCVAWNLYQCMMIATRGT